MTMFRRGVLAFGLAICVMIEAVGATGAHAQANISSQSKNAAIVVDAKTGEVLFARRADSPRYPASVTKLMTLYLTFQAISDGKLALTDDITMSHHAASQSPTKLGLREGRSLSVDDAIQAICVQSANDVAVAMAERLGGSESRFATMMTLKAEQLGMMNTHYVNASGLPDSRQISTARDLAILSRALMTDFPQDYAYFSTKQFTYEGRTMNNHNGLLLRMAGVDGLKTGFTTASGYNLAASATRDGRRLIVVVLGGTSNANRDNQVADLIETGFAVLHRRDAGETITIAQNIFDPSGRARSYASASVPAYSGPTAAVSPPLDGGPIQLASLTRMKPVPNPIQSRKSKAAVAAGSDDDAIQPVKNDDVKGVTSLHPTQNADNDAAPSDGRYMVQVGAFRQKTDARNQIKTISAKFGQQFAAAETSIGDAVGGMFRARFTGLSADAAEEACSALKAKHMTCMVIAP
jgi:D-alanyl-D-alanine carboxypeptidase